MNKEQTSNASNASVGRIDKKEMAVEITKELPRFGEKSNESLQKIIDALPPVEISPKLLEG